VKAVKAAADGRVVEHDVVHGRGEPGERTGGDGRYESPSPVGEDEEPKLGAEPLDRPRDESVGAVDRPEHHRHRRRHERTQQRGAGTPDHEPHQHAGQQPDPIQQRLQREEEREERDRRLPQRVPRQEDGAEGDRDHRPHHDVEHAPLAWRSQRRRHR
jgi:hypothetical protein